MEPVGEADSPTFLFPPLESLVYALGCLFLEGSTVPSQMASYTPICLNNSSVESKVLL